MKGIKVYVSEEVEKRFRELAMKLYGFGRGSISVAAEKAFAAWISQVSSVMDVTGIVEDPVAATFGMLKHVKKRGVELQHEARRIRARRSGKGVRGR